MDIGWHRYVKVCFMRTRRFPGIRGQVLGTVNMRRAEAALKRAVARIETCLLYTSPSPRD